MAALPDIDRQRVTTGLMRYWSKAGAEFFIGMLKTDLRAAVDYTDSWIDANQSVWNSGLPTEFRTNASMTQKSLLFCAVVLARVEIDLLRAVFGGVD